MSKKIKITAFLDFDSWFYGNCKAQRKRKSKCCDSCPFRSAIESAEIKLKTEK